VSVTLGRREFLVGSGVAGVAILSGPGSVVAAVEKGNCEQLTVYKLSPDWGYPRGPNAKTKLRSRASITAAEHRYALTAADAEAMNLHLCSYAPAVPTEVCKAAFMTLWDGGGYEWLSPFKDKTVRIFDSRRYELVERGEELLEEAGIPVPVIDSPAEAPLILPPPTPLPDQETTPSAPSLARTGASIATASVGGVALMAAGAAIVAAARRSSVGEEAVCGA